MENLRNFLKGLLDRKSQMSSGIKNVKKMKDIKKSLIFFKDFLEIFKYIFQGLSELIVFDNTLKISFNLFTIVNLKKKKSKMKNIQCSLKTFLTGFLRNLFTTSLPKRWIICKTFFQDSKKWDFQKNIKDFLKNITQKNTKNPAIFMDLFHGLRVKKLTKPKILKFLENNFRTSGALKTLHSKKKIFGFFKDFRVWL